MSRHRTPTPKQVAAVQKWEQETLSDFFLRMGTVGTDADLKILWQAVGELVFAQSPREVMDVIAGNPSLRTERADAVLGLTELYTAQLSMVFAPAIIKDRREWLTRTREVETGMSGTPRSGA